MVCAPVQDFEALYVKALNDLETLRCSLEIQYKINNRILSLEFDGLMQADVEAHRAAMSRDKGVEVSFDEGYSDWVNSGAQHRFIKYWHPRVV